MRVPFRPPGARGRPPGRGPHRAGLCSMALLMLLTGCDGPAPSPSDPGDGAQAPPDEPGRRDPGGQQAQTGPGATGVTSAPCPDATDEQLGCLHLGSLVDRGDDRASEHADELLAGQRDFWRRVNESGGVAGYEVRLADHVRDVTDDADQQATAAGQLLEDVLAFALLPGDASSAALVETLDERGAVGVLPGWWSGWRLEEHRDTLLLPAEHSRCLGAVVGLDWYVDAVGPPVSVLAIAPAGRVAADLEAGARAWAVTVGADWVGLTETGTLAEGDEQDEAVQAVLEHNPDLVLVGSAPLETGQLVHKAAARGFEGTFVGVVDTWEPSLLADGERAQALQALYHHVGPWEGLDAEALAAEGLDAEGVDAAGGVGRAIDAARGDAPLSSGYVTGWLSSYPLLAALRAAGDRGALTRDGLRDVVADLEAHDEGATPGAAPAGGDGLRAVVSAPDPGTDWGLSQAGPGVHAVDAEGFDHPHDCRPSR